jgi:hypothetical protein
VRPHKPPPQKFRANQDLLFKLICGLPPSRMPLIAPTALWVLLAAQPRRIDPGLCVSACLTIRQALEVFGIPSGLVAVRVGIGAVGKTPISCLPGCTARRSRISTLMVRSTGI